MAVALGLFAACGDRPDGRADPSTLEVETRRISDPSVVVTVVYMGMFHVEANEEGEREVESDQGGGHLPEDVPVEALESAFMKYLQRHGRMGHDDLLVALSLKSDAVLPYLYETMKSLDPPPQGPRICTYAHCVDLLREVTGGEVDGWAQGMVFLESRIGVTESTD